MLLSIGVTSIYPYHALGSAKALWTALSYTDAMYRICQLCGKEFQDFIEGVSYSSTAKGFLVFCSDRCCKDYLDVNVK